MLTPALIVIKRRLLIHDNSNQNPQVPAYAVVNLHTSYQLTPTVQLFGLVNNLFNTHYYATGTFTQINGGQGVFNSNTFGGNNFLVLNNPQTYLPGMPFAAYGGIRATF